MVSFPCLFLQSGTTEAAHPYLICKHLASAIFLAYWHSWFVTIISFPTFVFLTASSMSLLWTFSFFSPPPEAFTEICNKNLKFRRHPCFLSLTERKLSNQLIAVFPFFFQNIDKFDDFCLSSGRKKEGYTIWSCWEPRESWLAELCHILQTMPQLWVPGFLVAGSLRATEMWMSRGEKELGPEQQRHSTLNPPAARRCSLTWVLLR